MFLKKYLFKSLARLWNQIISFFNYWIIGVHYIFWRWSLFRYMVFKYFLPFNRLHFYSVDCLLCRSVLFKNVIPVIYFWFCCQCLLCHNHKIIAKITPRSFTVSSFMFELTFFYGIRDKGLISFFLHVDVQFSQHHLLKTIFSTCVFLATLSKINWLYVCGFILGLDSLPMVYSCLYTSILITVAS